jgi:Kef-type K+ transport system membrane component KefB/mannitol/fructose-specific phosphotransferase system IIA component (Ntr-type)
LNDSTNISLPFSDPVLIFALVMLIILLAPLAFRKLKIPGIVGLILSGAVVGPSMLGLLERDDTINLLGTVGLLYLMFMAGLSIDLNRFEKLRNRSIGFGFLSFSLPLAGAVATGLYLLDYSMATSLLLGSIVGSHPLLAYPITERLGITKNTPVTMALGGTLVTDTMSLGLRAVIAGSVGDDLGPAYWLGFSTSVLIFVVATLLILPRLGRWYFRNVKHETNTDFVFMVAVLFTTAFLADLAGLASIIGAFMAGLLLNRLVPESGTLMSRIHFVGNALFIPFFLISVGMLVDIGVLSSVDVWIKIILFTALVFAGKGLAAWIINKIFNYSEAEGWVVFGLTTPQSAATLAVTLIGYDLGFFDQVAVNAVVIMILFTCLLGPWLVEKYGRIVAIQEEEKPYEPSEAPQRILVPLANPETSDALMDIAFMVRDMKSDQPIYPLTVASDGKDVESQVARGEKMLSHAVIHAAAAEVPVNPVTMVDYNVASGVARAVREKLITNVIIGWNGQVSAKRRIFGSILDQLLSDLDEMIMVSKIEKPVNTFDRIVLAIPPFAALESGFPEAMRSVKLMTEQIGGKLVVLVTDEREPHIRKRVSKIKPSLEIDYQTIELWSKLPSWMDENQKEDDLFILMSAREGSLSWRPGLDRLPRVIAQKYHSLSFITIYPAEVEKDLQMVIDNKSLQILQENRIKIGIENGSIENVLADIIRADVVFRDIDIQRITRRLLENSEGYSPELMPGVLLFDSHSSKVDEQLLFIGVSKKGINIAHTANETYIVLIFLSPKNLSAQEHLKSLNRISKLITPGDGIEKIKKAASTREIVKVLMKT